jgi:hypothetical protein
MNWNVVVNGLFIMKAVCLMPVLVTEGTTRAA